MDRVLIIKFGAIGDVVMAISAAYELHRAGFEVDWVCGVQVLPLLELYPWIRPIVTEDRALFAGNAVERFWALADVWRRIAREEYEICATLYYDNRYRIVSWPVRAKRKVMLSHGNRLKSLLPGRHHTDEYLRVMLGKDDGPVPIGLPPVRPSSLPTNPLPRVDRTDRVVLVPGGARNAMRSDDLRRWPLQSYVAVGEGFHKRGIDVVLVGGPDDDWASAAFAGKGVTDKIGKLTLPETLALMEASDVVVTHDTGPLHLAGITSIGIVSIFGPTNPGVFLPQRAGTVALWGGEGFACRPCYDGRNYAPCANNQCMQQVSPEMVIREVTTLLLERRTGSLQPPRVVTPTSTVSEDWRIR